MVKMNDLLLNTSNYVEPGQPRFPRSKNGEIAFFARMDLLAVRYEFGRVSSMIWRAC